MIRASLTAALITVLASPPCAAAPCPVDPALGRPLPLPSTDHERARFIETRIARGVSVSRAWTLGWGVSLAALAGGQLAIAPFVPREERPEWWVGAGASAVGALTRAVFRPRVLREQRNLARDRTHGCARLAALEGALLRSARWEQQGRGLLMHGLSLGFNAGVGLLLGLAFDRPIAGNRLAALGGVIGELMIITQPQFMSRTQQEYGRRPTLVRRVTTQPMVTVGGGGIALRGRI